MPFSLTLTLRGDGVWTRTVPLKSFQASFRLCKEDRSSTVPVPETEKSVSLNGRPVETVGQIPGIHGKCPTSASPE